MTSPALVEVLGRQRWLDSAGAPLQQAVRDTLAAGPSGRAVANALYGTWLGHPLHPALVSIPLGAWTVALVLDALDASMERRALGRGADVAIAVGVAGALGSAASGLADWHHESGRSARAGLAHGLLNLSATALYAASLVLRKRRERAVGRTCALLGFAIASTAGYLGGDLVFGQQLGVDRTAGLSLPAEFVPVLAEADLPEGEPRRVEANGAPVLLVRHGQQIHALAETCSHRGGPLAEGKLEDGCVVCPWHGSRFALDDGRVVDGPATFPQPVLETRVHEGQVEVRAAPRWPARETV